MKAGDYTREILLSFGQFFMVFMGSVLIGAFAALLIAFILKRQSQFNREQAEVPTEPEVAAGVTTK